MKLASCQIEGRRFAAEIQGDSVLPIAGSAPLGIDTDFGALADAPREEAIALDSVELLPVIPAPAKIFCLGLNYKGHVEETGRDLPDYPVLFTKFADSLVGAADPIVKPPESDRLDYEAELAVVIGTAGRRIAKERALEHVAGYTIANDVTARDYQRRSSQWLQGKTWPRSTPLGPWLVTPDELGDASGRAISLQLNGEERQRSDTSLMIFDVATAVSTISEFTPLGPGDVILMGTPDGVGFKSDPPSFLAPGDRIRVEIDGIGSIENEVAAEPTPG
jgi:acylpyruvate hydrolase